MNDLAKTLQERREQLGGVDKMREQLNRLKDIAGGPADKIAEAMKQGDFQKAVDELKNLQEKLSNGQLTEEEKQQLIKQLERIQNRLQELKESHEQAKRDLEEEIRKRQAAGDLEGAGKLQQQLDRLNRMNDQMDALQKLAQQLGQCRECLQNGDGKAAAAQLDQMAQGLKDLQAQMDQLETLDQMLDEIAMAKEAMGCQQCNGEGCEACLGQFGMDGKGNDGEPGMGLGEGRGKGDRPETKTDTSMYESRVKGNVQPGEAVRTGTAGGPNQAGNTLQEVKEQLQSNFSQDADPLTDLRLPKKEREHTREYFRRYREGE
jgi:DNA repair exonuclease SbcCD ATPase subunit